MQGARGAANGEIDSLRPGANFPVSVGISMNLPATGGRHGRHVTFQLAEVAVPKELGGITFGKVVLN